MKEKNEGFPHPQKVTVANLSMLEKTIKELQAKEKAGKFMASSKATLSETLDYVRNLICQEPSLGGIWSVTISEPHWDNFIAALNNNHRMSLEWSLLNVKDEDKPLIQALLKSADKGKPVILGNPKILKDLLDKS